MPINRDYVGRSYSSGEGYYEVSREKIRDFAIAIGDNNPLYTDPDAAKAAGYPDVIAPPTFATVLQFRLGGTPMGEADLGLNYAMVVHGEQRYVHHRPLRPGDRVRSTSTVTDIHDAGRNELMTISTEVSTVEGEPVLTAISTIVSRGTAAPKEG